MRRVALPYRTGSDGCWTPGRWRRVDGEGELELGEKIDDWDYSIPLTFICDVTVRPGRLRNEVGLAPEDPILLVAIWESSSTGIREVGSLQELAEAGDASFELLVHVDGSRIGGQLTLERQVVLGADSSSTEPLAPRAAGSLLLVEPRDRQTRIVLEGESARFPTEVISFEELPIAEPDALWYLEYDPSDLEQSPLVALRLYVNSRHPAVERSLRPDDEIGQLVRSTLHWDVARTMIERALPNDDLVEQWDAFPEESLGRMLQELIQRSWPGETAESLRARRLADPARFEYQLQARFRLYRDVA